MMLRAGLGVDDGVGGFTADGPDISPCTGTGNGTGSGTAPGPVAGVAVVVSMAAVVTGSTAALQMLDRCDASAGSVGAVVWHVLAIP